MSEDAEGPGWVIARSGDDEAVAYDDRHTPWYLTDLYPVLHSPVLIRPWN